MTSQHGSNPGAVGAAAGGGQYAGTYGPHLPSASRHGNAEPLFRSSHFEMTSQFGMTPPGSRAGTPPRRSDRGFMRTPSPRRAPGEEEEPRRERSREEEAPRGTRARAAAEEQPLPAEWGGRMLRVERIMNEVCGHD